MQRYYNGEMIMRQQVFEWWPNLDLILTRLNYCAEIPSPQNRDKFFKAIKGIPDVIQKDIRNGTIENMSELQKDLGSKLRRYHEDVKRIVTRKRQLKNRLRRDGKPLKESTLKTYRSELREMILWREKSKQGIKHVVNEIKSYGIKENVSKRMGSLRLIQGGKA